MSTKLKPAVTKTTGAKMTSILRQDNNQNITSALNIHQPVDIEPDNGGQE